jgi:phosphoribosylglycinamide formyltransferase-1
MTDRLPVVVLISGNGSNMCAIADHAARDLLPVEIRAVVSDRTEAPGLEHARKRNIATATLSSRDYPSREAFDAQLANLVGTFAPRLVILAGYMKILSTHFVSRFAGHLLNIHPSLLPKYPGLSTHRRVLEAGDKEHGATVHFVTDELDGGPLIAQGRLAVQANDSEASLAARVHRVEHIIYPEVVNWFANRRLRLAEGSVVMDGKKLERPMMIAVDEYDQS